MPKIFIAVPVLGGLDVHHISSVSAHMQDARECGHDFQVNYLQGTLGIARVRNRQVADFLGTDCDYYCQIDADVEIMQHPVEKNLFKTLLAHDKPFIGAIYRCHQQGAAGSSIGPDGKRLILGQGLVEARWLAGGCWLLKREVVEKVVAGVRDMSYFESYGGIIKERAPAFNEVFAKVIMGGEKRYMLLSEDYAFCQRWLTADGEIWADTDIRLRHWGRYGYVLEDPAWRNLEGAMRKKEEVGT